MQTTAPAAQQATLPQAAAKQIPPTARQAIACAMDCFGASSPEALRFAQYMVERSGLPWLTDAAPAATPATTAGDSA